MLRLKSHSLIQTAAKAKTTDNDKEAKSVAVVSELNIAIDRDGKRGRPAGNIASHKDGCAELSQRPGKGEHAARDDAADGQWKGDGQKNPEWRGSQRGPLVQGAG